MTVAEPKTPEARAAAGAPKRHRILVCPPDHFSVDYVINPWMQGNTKAFSLERAKVQWAAFVEVLGRDADLATMEPQPGVPDLVFTANAGLAYGKRLVLSRFRHEERRPEEPINKRWFEANGFEVIEMPQGLNFEGAGDALFDRGTPRLFMGYGFRTDLESADFVAHALGVEVVPLRLVDERFYHLDTCFCPLDGGKVVYYPNAFDERALRAIEEAFAPEDRHAVSERDAVHFACNAVDTGRSVVLNNCTPELQERLESWGFRVERVDLSEFILAGGSAKCLSLRLDEPVAERAAAPHAPDLRSRVMTMEGHLLDTGAMARAYNIISEAGASFETHEFRVGQRREHKSFVRMTVSAPDEAVLEEVLAQLMEMGAKLEDPEDRPARLVRVDKDGVAPEDFYSTTIYPTEVLVEGRWARCERQRMDGIVRVDRSGAAPTARCVLIRDLRVGDEVVVGADGIRVLPHTAIQEDPSEFKFMSSGVSSERRVEIVVDQIAWEIEQIRKRRGKIVFVPGPVCIHTGGVQYLSELIRRGYVNALLSGNALATHDIERSMFGTSLGVDLRRGVPVHGGHKHHLIAINEIRRAGSIAEAVAKGVLKEGIMYELVKAGVPFCLAGSIRDDGPLPDTEMDLVKAQARYAELLEGAEMIIMLSSMLHAIGVGNMTPAGVRLVCVDINPAVATKLSDRGSVESTPVVTDVGLFLNLLVRKLDELKLDQPAAAGAAARG